MAERLSILNDPPRVLPGPHLLHELIDFESHGDACAIDFTKQAKREQYTYQDIQTCVTALVARIQQTLPTNANGCHNASTQHIVPVLLPQSPGLYIAQLAILQSGGAFCPINLDAPRERIKFVVRDVAAKLVITTSEFKDLLSWEDGPAAIVVDEFPNVTTRVMRIEKSREPTKHDLAYVMYTSGSSGTPKGVAVSHLAASQSLLAHEKLLPAFKRFLQFAAPSFDVSVFEIFFPLTRGCTLVGCDRSQLLNDLPRMINQLDVDAAELTPTVVGSLLQKRSHAPKLKLLLTIGEMLTTPIVEEFGGNETKDAVLYGMYGPTEAAIHCTIFPKMASSTKPGNIGVPFETVSTFIAAASSSTDEDGSIKLLPLGEPGELVLGGLQLANGYLNREEQNKAAFVQCGGKKFYRTGDKARQLGDGTIEILGRMSAGQVKLRGQRIELGEIEEAVYKHPGINTVAAVVLSGALVVFALTDDESIQSEHVSATCAKWLPKFMIPGDIVLLRRFSYLPSGKVDKRKLEADYQAQLSSGTERNASSTPTERLVERALTEVLGSFSRRNRLAAAGIDSLNVIRVASKLRSAGLNITTVAVLRAETFADLTKKCEQAIATRVKRPQVGSFPTPDSVRSALNGNAKDVDVTMPCTPLQTAMLSETAVQAKAYRNWIELELPGVSDPRRVMAALGTLAVLNPILRTGFAESRDLQGFVQIVWRSLPSSQIEFVDAFDYEFNASKDTRLHHPLRAQILQRTTSTKLLIHLHHALYDAWSLELVFDDLNALLMGQIPPSRPTFAKVVDGYLNNTLSGGSHASKEYWKDHLSDLELRQVPNFHTTKGTPAGLAIAKLSTAIPTAEVENVAKALSSSSQSIFQAAYSLVLSSYLGSSDVCFGTVFSGRTLPIDDIEEIVGPCLSTLPVRIDTSTVASFGQLVQDLNSTNRKHLEHSTLPLRDIKSAFGANPQQSLFDTLLIWQQTLHSYDHNRPHVNLVESVDNLEFNLTIEVVPGSGNIQLRANYQQSLFPEAQIDFLLQQVEQLASVIIKDSSLPISDAFTNCTSDILSIENEDPHIDLKPGTLSSPVEQLARDHPERSAIEFATAIGSTFKSQKVTYSQLNSQSNQIGRYLVSRDVLPDELVCICIEKSVSLYASILASAKIGAGYLPVTPDVPHERLQHILREAKVKIVLAHSSSRALLKTIKNVEAIYLDELNLDSISTQNIPPRSLPEHISYCVFTSGSTGTPKGVMVTQRNLLSNLDVLEDLYPASGDVRLLQSCSQAFDVSVFEIFSTWRIGGCICSAVKDVLFQDIENAIRALRVTHLSLTPTVASLVDPQHVPTVQFLVTAGEAVTQKVFSAWAGKGLYQGYGPSETTNICTVNPNVSLEDSINNIGPPFKNTSAFVLSPGPDFSIAPRGAEGEFCFGGSQVFRGYMDPNQNIGKIIDHPKFGRLYRSGDFGRMMPDGSLAFTGRKDDQVKIRGQRVELGEINSIMLKSNHVRDCVTMVIGGTDASQRLVCFWSPHSENLTLLECLTADAAVLKTLYKSLDSALPKYMVPSALVPISHLPSTTQGKIDKRLLVRLFNELDLDYLDTTSQNSQSSTHHTWSDLEQDIARVLADHTDLSLQTINPDTSFFSLGIDSISAISLSRKLRKALRCQVDISDILKYPSVARLGERLSSRSGDSNIVGQFKSRAYEFDKAFLTSTSKEFEDHGMAIERILPCTPLQEAMLSAADSSSESLYKNEVILNVHGSVGKLQACWEAMAKRHEILRTCFVATDMPRYAYVQIVLEEFQPTFNIINESNTSVEKHSVPDAKKSFLPPYGFDLIRSQQSTKLVISMHHALYDGIALSVLFDEVEKFYQDQPLPPALSFAPFLNYMLSNNTAQSDQYWESILRGCIPTRVGILDSQSSERSHSSVLRRNALLALSSIAEKTKRHSTSLLAVCHTVWTSVLAERFETTDVCFGNVVSGRTLPIEGIDRLVAPCFNTIPIRFQDTHKNSYLESFRRSQTFNANSLAFQSTPLRRLQSKFSPDGLRLFDTLFLLQQPSKDLDSSLWSISQDNGAMDFPLVCEVAPCQSNGTLEIILYSKSAFISDEDAASIMESFNTKLQTALDNPRHQLLSSDVKERILAKKVQVVEEEDVSNHASDHSMPMTPEELQIRDIVADFTDVPVEKITRDVSIFRLGLDSISAVQVAGRLRKQGYSVLASDILERPTIAQLEAYLAKPQNAAEGGSVYDFTAFDAKLRDAICSTLSVKLEDVEAVRPCTAVQQGMIAQSMHSDGGQYVNSIWFELSPKESMPKLKAAWTAVFEKYEMLRSGFVATNDPKIPFTLVTYTKESFSLPWKENNELQTVFNAEKLASGPWLLSAEKNGGKSVLKFTAHHALYDAQSMQMILSDVAKYYSSKQLASHSDISSLLGPVIQQERNDTEGKKTFWQRIENKVVVNRFPDLTPLRISGITNEVREIFSKAPITELESLCRQKGVTMQAAGQAAWARLLAAYTGEVSTTFGITLSGRSVSEDADSIPFPTIVTLPVRCDVTGTNEALLTRTVSSNAQLHKYQFTPLTSIQRWAGLPEGNMFDTLFAYQKLSPTEDEVKPPWKVVREEATVDYAVSLEVQPTKAGKLTLRLTFRDNVIPVEHAEILLKQYDVLLLDLLQNSEGPCDMVADAGSQLLSITPAKDPVIKGSIDLLHEFLERGVCDHPGKTALEFATCLEIRNFQTESWTYEQVNEESNKIAHLLCQRKIPPGQLIAICFDKCPQASFAIVGILKAGCAYVALDPNAPAERMKFIIEDSGAKLILTAGKPADNFETMAQEIVNLDTPNVLDDCSADSATLARKITPQDTSYCLYTSGTTGTPKGCLISHENAVQAMYSFQRLFSPHWTKDSKWLQFASFHFDVSVLEQFWSWSVGICVVSAPRDLIFEDIPGAIQRLGITHIDLTPSLARLVHPDDVPSLCKGVFITGGEQLRQDILDVWGKHACIYNGYGPTEATIGCTMYPRVPKNGKPANIGPQFDNVGSYVLRPGTSLPVLRGAVGELCVSGKLVGKGYLNRPDLTKERFPTIQPFNERVYRTGDLVRILHDGSFIFLGRADDQVKLRGQRLELSEINQVIKKRVDELDEVVTLVLRHKTQQKEQLVTFFLRTAQNDEQVSPLIGTMRDACKARLPGYMVPTHFISIDALPLNGNNKADAKQLAALYDDLSIDDLQKLSRSSQQNKEWFGGEMAILDVLAKTLVVEVSTLTRDATIFELGLDSISIIGFSHALQASGLGNAKISVIKNNPALENLVAALMDGEDTNREVENAQLAASQYITAFSQSHLIHVCQELGLESTEIQIIAPTTPAQEGMIYRFLESQHALYFHNFKFVLEASIDLESLSKAWRTVVARLEILRTKFVVTDDGFAQVVVKSLDNPANSTIDYDNVDKSVALQNPHTMEIKLTSSGRILSLRLFHGLYDGNSLTMILQSVVGEYHSLEKIDYGPSFHSSLQFGPLIKLPGAVAFWKDHLRDWKAHSIPSNLTPNKDVVTTRHLRNLEGVEKLRKKLGVTHQAMIQATWLSVLQSILSPSLTIGVVTSGRSIDFEGADKVIGPLFNTLPFHATIEKGMTSASFTSRCHELNMKIQDFQHTPLKDIQKRSPAQPGQSLFDTLFVFLRPELEDEDFAKGVWSQLEEEQTADVSLRIPKAIDFANSSQYPLAFEASLSPKSEELRLTIIAQGSKFVESQAVDLLDRFEEALRTLLNTNGTNIISNDAFTKASTDDTSIAISQHNVVRELGSFAWTKQATQIRSEVAALAGTDESQVHETSSIFELGLDSIDVIKLSSRLNKRGITISVSAIIKAQTVASISTNISNNNNKHQKSPSGKTVREMSRDLTEYLKNNGDMADDIEAVLPATPLQQSMVNEMTRSKYTRYFTVEAFELSGEVDAPRLMQSVQQVINGSPILRTTFIEIDDPQIPLSYAQLVHSKTFSSIERINAEDIKVCLEEFKKTSIASAVARKSLCHVQCVTLQKSSYLLMAISHALYDGRSLRAVHEDIEKAYRGSLSTRPDSLPYLDAVFQSTTDEAKRFWRSALSNLPQATFPRRKASDVTNPTVVHRLETYSQVSLKDIEAFCRSARITLQTLGQTCWAIVLSHLMSQLDVIFGSVLSCRDTEEADEVMFPLMNTVAVRSVLHGNVSEMLKYMQEMSDMTRQFQHFPLGTAQACALASREAGPLSRDTTLFDTLFIYQGHRQKSKSELLYTSVYGSSDVEFPVCVEMEIDGNQLAWTTACKSIAQTATETKSTITALDSVLQHMIANPQGPVIVSESDGISVCGLSKFQRSAPLKKYAGNAISTLEEQWSEIELKIREVLHTVSGAPLKDIRKDLTIFHLGLDSILVLKLPALLRKQGIKLSVSTIMKEQTIHAMAQAVLRSEPQMQDTLDVEKTLTDVMPSLDTASMLELLKAEAGHVQYAMPVTAGQQYMLRSWEASKGVLFYPTFEFSLSVPVNKAQLDTAWEKLLQAHDILRTGFVELDSKLIQIVFKDRANEVIYTNQKPVKTQKTMSDLRCPPVKLIVEQLEISNTTLKLEIHHALYDGISIPIILEKLQSLYHGQELAESELHFQDFVAQSIVASHNHQSKSDKSLSRVRWESYLKSAPNSSHSKIHTPSTLQSRTEAFHPGMQVSPLKNVAQEAGVSIDALLLAALSKQYTQRLAKGNKIAVSQVVFGIYLANRAPFGDDLSKLVAPTLNLLPLRVQDPLSRSLFGVAKDIQRDIREISSAEMVSASLADIYEWCGVRVDFFVNILKDVTAGHTEEGDGSSNVSTDGEDLDLTSTQDFSERAEVVEVASNEDITTGQKHEAYMPSVDVEIRYHGSSIDMGVFGPTAKVSIEEAQEMIRGFAEFLR